MLRKGIFLIIRFKKIRNPIPILANENPSKMKSKSYLGTKNEPNTLKKSTYGV
jgi:hypothetical protein